MKKFLSIILALALLTGIAGTAAFAEEVDEGDYLTGDIAFDTKGLLNAFSKAIFSAYQDSGRIEKLLGDKASLSKDQLEQLAVLLRLSVNSQFEETDEKDFSDNDDQVILNFAELIQKAFADKEFTAKIKEFLKILPEKIEDFEEKIMNESIDAFKKNHSDVFEKLSDEEIDTMKAAIYLLRDAFDEDSEEESDEELDEHQLNYLDFLSLLVHAAVD